MLGDGSHLTRRQTRKRQYVGRAVPKFGEEPHEGLCSLIRSDDQTTSCAGQSILRDHPLTRLDVTEMKLSPGWLDQIPAFNHDCIEHRVGGWLDVDCDDPIRSDYRESPLCVRFVSLDAIGQSDSDEFGIVSISAEF